MFLFLFDTVEREGKGKGHESSFDAHLIRNVKKGVVVEIIEGRYVGPERRS